ncbi:hypothetical protein PS655_03957 [Pseudomonas fluorescens]|uniref:Uncharacterized protein n=1 Tax=Pseudomonas fluorescens TaxID=294 RepID=A0A5E6V5R5_PSEFL|nr:hypothetical protein PS655_03957 [Pseudomonas fluorescens]
MQPYSSRSASRLFEIKQLNERDNTTYNNKTP